jgi:hypothetical protein
MCRWVVVESQLRIAVKDASSRDGGLLHSTRAACQAELSDSVIDVKGAVVAEFIKHNNTGRRLADF